jgi:F-type H+-transporting ATPase subunit alpha
MNLRPEEISAVIKQQIIAYDTKVVEENVGYVLQSGDGIARIYGLRSCMYGELLEFENGVRGKAMNLEEDNIGCVFCSVDDTEIQGRNRVRSTGKPVEVPVGDSPGRKSRQFPSASPIDGRGEIKNGKSSGRQNFLAPGVNDRKSVDTPPADRHQWRLIP